MPSSAWIWALRLLTVSEDSTSKVTVLPTRFFRKIYGKNGIGHEIKTENIQTAK